MGVFKKSKNFSRKYIKWQKDFVRGNQFTHFNPTIEAVECECVMFYWESQRVFNLIKPVVDKWDSLFSKGVWGEGKAVDQLIDYQKQYNKYMNTINEMTARVAFPILCVEDGSVDVDELSEEGLSPGKILVYRQGSKMPETMEKDHSKETMEIIWQLAQNVKAELINLMASLEENLCFENNTMVIK